LGRGCVTLCFPTETLRIHTPQPSIKEVTVETIASEKIELEE
jgi:hypothetical protein